MIELRKMIQLSLMTVTLLMMFSLVGCSQKSDYTVTSPTGEIKASLKFNKKEGTLSYSVQSWERNIISESSIGMNTSLGDFRSGIEIESGSQKTIDETYNLPQGKTLIYRNHAHELTLSFSKNEQPFDVLFRVYDDGVAFRFSIPGKGEIEIYEENSAINLVGEDFTYWGQNHPNRYGYEGALGPIEGDRMSNPVLAHLKSQDHFVLMGQAATIGDYIQSHFQRSKSSFLYSFPLDQEQLGPVKTTLPFRSPWRMIVISPQTPSKIVESYLPENLNPPTDSVFLNPDGSIQEWIKPGRVMWDFIAGDGEKPRMWIDAVEHMGWEYYMADAGFAKRWGGGDSVAKITEYAGEHNVNVIGWAHTREFNTYQKAAQTLSRYADWGLKGAKIDFFDHNTLSENPMDWRDYEDTQESLRMRDWIFDLAIQNNFLLELHGNTIPTGERRQYPNLMSLEGVDGMERRTKPAANDLTIPYIRNVMGPVSYTIVHFERSPGTHAYQMAMSVIYEAGLKIYAEHGKQLLEWPGREMIKDVPAEWDETRFIEGLPASHIVLARRKGMEWYIGGITDKARTVVLSLDFLTEGIQYKALIFSDETFDSMTREESIVDRGSTLTLQLLERGGFTIRILPQ